MFTILLKTVNMRTIQISLMGEVIHEAKND